MMKSFLNELHGQQLALFFCGDIFVLYQRFATRYLLLFCSEKIAALIRKKPKASMSELRFDVYDGILFAANVHTLIYDGKYGRAESDEKNTVDEFVWDASIESSVINRTNYIEYLSKTVELDEWLCFQDMHGSNCLGITIGNQEIGGDIDVGTSLVCIWKSKTTRRNYPKQNKSEVFSKSANSLRS
jgi:hypothetical protein